MQVDVERRPGSLVALTVSVEPAVVEQQMEQLFQKYARRVTVPGFRPGKAPRHLVEARIERSALIRDAVEDVIESTYKTALREQQIEPLERGEIEDVQTGDDLSLTYRVIVPVRPQVSLPDLATLTVDYTSTKVTEEQVEAEVERLLTSAAVMSEILDEGIQQGDLVTVDYTVKIGDADYPEGATNGYPLEIGSDTFFPELNDGLLGAKQGEVRMVSKDYPPEYTHKDLAGNTAEYAILVQHVQRKVTPELSDAWVLAVTNGALTTVEELRARINENLLELAERMDRDQIREELIRQVVRNATMEIPDAMVAEEHEHLMHELENRLARDYMDLEEYAESIDRTVEEIKDDELVMARDFVRRSLVMQEIARCNMISVTEEDIEALLILEGYHRGEHDVNVIRKQLKTIRKEMEKSGRLDHMASRLFQEKILSFLEQHAQVTIEGQPLQPEQTSPAEEIMLEESADEEADTE